jgi:hypothetical protein
MLNCERLQQDLPTQRLGNPELDSTFLLFVNNLAGINGHGKVGNCVEIIAVPVDNLV